MTLHRSCLRRLFLALAFSTFALQPATAGEVIHSDGRRETVTEARQGKNGQWTAVREGRRTVLRSGDVVVVIDDDGKELDLIPELTDSPLTQEQSAVLERMRDLKNDSWSVEFQSLAETRSQAVLDSLVGLTSHKDKRLRVRAVQALARLATRESVEAATKATLSEAHKRSRGEAASALFGVREIFTRCKAVERISDGLEDANKTVRVVFALIGAKAEGEPALAVLRKDGLKNKDHHIREEAALELGLQADGAGMKILLAMLKRAAIPGLEGHSEELQTAVLVREKTAVCAALEKIGDPAALPALRKAAESPLEGVAEAAQKVIALLELISD